MRYLIPLLLFIWLLIGCEKTATTNNYIDNDHLQAFSLEGLHDFVLSTEVPIVNQYLTLRHTDSSQQRVHVYVSGLPDGITVDTTMLIDGYPTYTFTLSLNNRIDKIPAVIGVYEACLNVVGDVSGLKKFPFLINVTSPSSCTNDYTGLYYSCSADCNPGNFADTITADSLVPNKIWLSNFNNQGRSVYAFIQCADKLFTIPAQPFANDDSISGMGNVINGSAANKLVFNVQWGKKYCVVYMR